MILDRILDILHHVWVIIIIFGFVFPKNFLPFILTLNILVLTSWLIFRKCIWWDLQMKVNPDFKVEKDISDSFKNNIYIISIIQLLSLNVIGLRLGIQKYIFLITLLYIILNEGIKIVTIDNIKEKYYTNSNTFRRYI